MHSSNVSTHGMAVAPHHLASQSALAILREGGSAIEAMVAAAAAIAVVYPHMNGLGGDGFWLIVPPEGDPIAIDASGAAGSLATLEAYAGQRHIPHRGAQAALTVAGTVSGWDEALRISRDLTGRALPVARLLADAIGYAEDGIPVTASQAHATASKLEELRHQPGFSETWLVAGEAPRPGSRFRQPALAGTLRMLASDGLDSFYRGPLAERLAQGMAALGMPVTLRDLQAHRARRPAPLTLQHQQGTLWNLAPPTQGLVSLAILGITDRLNMADADDAQTVHRIVEATKRAFALRDAHITDPRHLDVDVQQLLTPEALQPLADSIDDASASPWGRGKGPGDTVWMGVVDNSGLAVSFIQSIYHEFGSGVVLPDTGIVWQNRGAAFSLDPQHLLALAPGKQPFHTPTLPPRALNRCGRVMVWRPDGRRRSAANAGGAVYSLSCRGGAAAGEHSSALAVGRTWASPPIHWKLEDALPCSYRCLREPGHDVEVLADFSEAMATPGHCPPSQRSAWKGATDPCSNGAAAGY
ncbi:oxamate amidohydrolase [Klebsiella pneumoniae]|nr:oxamate amidohydrolase [Klebsiella pneumoniae]